MSENKRKLNNYLLDPHFQLKFIFWLSSTGLVLIFSLCFVFYSFIDENYQLIVELSDLTDEAKNLLYSELEQIIYIISAICFLFVLITCLIGIIISHKVVGPLYNLQNTFDSIRNGDLSKRARFRPNDEFQSLALHFNKMMDSITKND